MLSKKQILLTVTLCVGSLLSFSQTQTENNSTSTNINEKTSTNLEVPKTQNENREPEMQNKGQQETEETVNEKRILVNKNEIITKEEEFEKFEPKN